MYVAIFDLIPQSLKVAKFS